MTLTFTILSILFLGCVTFGGLGSIFEFREDYSVFDKILYLTLTIGSIVYLCHVLKYIG
jgi:hypothetical protein